MPLGISQNAEFDNDMSAHVSKQQSLWLLFGLLKTSWQKRGADTIFSCIHGVSSQ